MLDPIIPNIMHGVPGMLNSLKVAEDMFNCCPTKFL